MKRFSRSIAPLLATVLATATGRGQAFVSPLVVEQTPGTVTIANSGSEPLRLDVELADFDQDGNGRTVFSPVGHSRNSCGERLRVTDAPTQVHPRGEIRLVVTVEEATQLCWGAVLVHLSTGFSAGARFGVKVYATPPATTRAVEVSRIALERDTLHVDLVNTGAAPIRPHGRIELRTLDGVTVASDDITPFGLHPGVRRTVAVPIRKGTAPGRYVVLALFDVGLPDLVAGEAQVQVASWAAAP